MATREWAPSTNGEAEPYRHGIELPGAQPRGVRARVGRFAIVGAAAGALQLVLLFALEQTAMPHLVTNAIALAAAAQANFACSSVFTWRDRGSARGLRGLASRWVRFHAGIATTALLNFAVYALLATELPPLVAAAGGIGVAAAANFLIADRLVFRASASTPLQFDAASPVSGTVGIARSKEYDR